MRVRCACCGGSGAIDLSTPNGMRSARIALGLTGKEAADVVGVHPTTIANFEHGRLWHLSQRRIEKYRSWLLSEAATSS